jgi:hypothetical protein
MQFLFFLKKKQLTQTVQIKTDGPNKAAISSFISSGRSKRLKHGPLCCELSTRHESGKATEINFLRNCDGNVSVLTALHWLGITDRKIIYGDSDFLSAETHAVTCCRSVDTSIIQGFGIRFGKKIQSQPNWTNFEKKSDEFRTQFGEFSECKA